MLSWAFQTNRICTILALCACAASTISASQDRLSRPSLGDKGIRIFDTDLITSEEERGYGARLTPTASRLNVPIEELPINASIVSNDFLNDINESDSQNVLSWNASVSGGRNSLLRGFEGDGHFTEGHAFNLWYPSAYIERLEIAKGPASMWVSRANPGGTVHIIRKKAIRGVDENELKIGWGDANGQPRYHLTLDSNQAINDDMAIRFIADYAEREDDTMPGGIHTASDHSGTRAGMISISTHNRLFQDKMDLRFGFMRFQSTIKSQDGRGTARGARLTFNEGNFVPDSVAVPIAPGSQVPVNIAYPNDIDPFEDFGWGREFPIESAEYYLDVTHQFSDTLTGTFKANYLTSNLGHRDSNGLSAYYPEFLKDGTPNDGPDPEPAVRETWFAADNWLEAPDAQAYVQWEPKLENARQIFTAGVSRSNDFTEYTNYRLNHPGTDDPFTRDWFFRIEEHPRKGPEPGEYNKTLQREMSRDTTFTTANLNWFGQFAEGRLSLMAGVSFNDIEDKVMEYSFDIANPGELGEPTTIKRIPTQDTLIESSATNPMFGALWKLNRNASIFGQYSTSLDPSEEMDAFGDTFDPVYSKGIEAGIKIHAANDKVRGSIVYYRTKEDDKVVWIPSEEDYAYLHVVGLEPDRYEQAGSITGDGIEIDMQLNLTENWHANISYAHNFDLKITDHPIASEMGLTQNGFIPNALAFYKKYRFSSGALEGFQIGAGLIYRADQERRILDLEYRDEAYKRFDLHFQYHHQLSERVRSVIKLTLRNITEEKAFYTGWDAVNNQKFALENPMAIWLDYKLNF